MHPCALCDSREIEEIPETSDVRHWKCKRCGEVIVVRSILSSLPKRYFDLWLLSAYCRKRTNSDLPPVEIHSNNLETIVEEMKSSKPANAIEAQNRIIEFFGQQSDLLGGWIQYDEDSHLDVILQKKEMEYMIVYLDEQRFLEVEGGIDDVVGQPWEDDPKQFGTGRMRLTVAGWNKLEDLQRNRLNSNLVFVAMNFDLEHLEIYNNCIEPAVKKAGFVSYRTDQDRHIENINNRIIAKIRESRFLIADFTGHKHGVYFEAGFALGLGIPVIWTCAKADFGQTHFDTKPFNHIVWSDKEQLEEELYWFIKSNIT